MPTVLIADDSLSVRKVAERLLIAAGFDVALAASGEEALERFSASKPDILIADVIMPGKTGFEVCAEVRSHATLSATPVLLISGVVDEEITRQAVACRADGVIKKPFHGTSLPDRALSLLAEKKAAALAKPEPPPVVIPKRAVSEKIPAPASPSKISGITEDHLKNVRVPETENSLENTSGPKVFRITEDQLEKVLETATLAKDVESRMSEAQHRASELEEQILAFREAATRAEERIRELELALAEEQKRPGPLEEENSAFREAAMNAAGRIQELELALAEEQKRPGPLEEENSAFREAAMNAAGRIQELEGTAAETQKRSGVLEVENSAFREATMSAAGRIRELELTLADERKKPGVMEEQNSTLREAAMSAAGRIRELEVELAEAQKRSTTLVHRVAEMEHAASCAQKLADIFAEISRLPKA
jgi:CheY-like chemotaxis protein